MLHKWARCTGIAVLLAAPAATAPSKAAGEARLWVGLKDGDDRGTPFDMRIELYVNDTRVAEGEALCVTGIARSPVGAKEVAVAFQPVTDAGVAAGSVLALKVLTRIGTNPNGTNCGSHGDGQGLRLYYDGASRPSRFRSTITPGPSAEYFLRSTRGDLRLDTTPPRVASSKKEESGPVSFGGGNPWVEMGTWQCVVVAEPARLFTGDGPGGAIPDGSGTDISGTPFRSSVTVPDTFTGPISEVRVEFHGLQHTWAGDLRVRLVHPDGVTSVDLLSRPGRGAGETSISSTWGFASDFAAADSYSFSDNGTIVFLPHPFGGPPGGWQQGPLIPAGTYRPSSNPNPPDSNAFDYDYYPPVSFAATFAGMSAVGDWKLEITDWAEEEVGSLEGWTLNICAGGCPAVRTRLGDELFKLTAFDAGLGWEYGHSVALSGNTAIVGSPYYGGAGASYAGSAYLVDVSTGRQLALLPPSDDIGQFVRFGFSVAIDGNTALVGALYDRVDVVGIGFATGSVYVFDVSDPSHPVEGPKLIPSDATGDFTWEFGDSVAIRGNLAVVGAPGGGSVIARTPGTAYLFDVTKGVELAKLTASDAAVGDGFGTSVAVSGHTIVVGAPFKDRDAGAAYVVDVSDPGHPVERFKLTASDAVIGFPDFGFHVAISGTLALVGAPGVHDGAFLSGAAYLFDVTTGQQLAKLTASVPPDDFRFGWSVALRGNTAVVGAPFTDGSSGFTSGCVYLFDVSRPRHPVELMRLEASDAEDADWYGSSVALGGDTLLVGATQSFTSAGKAFLYRGRGVAPRPDPSPIR